MLKIVQAGLKQEQKPIKQRGAGERPQIACQREREKPECVRVHFSPPLSTHCEKKEPASKKKDDEATTADPPNVLDEMKGGKMPATNHLYVGWVQSRKS